jgi:hypothetical protein
MLFHHLFSPPSISLFPLNQIFIDHLSSACSTHFFVRTPLPMGVCSVLFCQRVGHGPTHVSFFPSYYNCAWLSTDSVYNTHWMHGIYAWVSSSLITCYLHRSYIWKSQPYRIYIYNIKITTFMIPLSPSISSLSFKTNIKQSESVSLPEITSIMQSQQNNFIKMNHLDMNSQGISIVNIYIY